MGANTTAEKKKKKDNFICTYAYVYKYKTLLRLLLSFDRAKQQLQNVKWQTIVFSVGNFLVVEMFHCFDRFYLLVCLIMFFMIFFVIEQSTGIYVDCQARCLLTSRRERNRDSLQICRDQCELLELLEKEDIQEGKYHRYRLFN